MKDPGHDLLQRIADKDESAMEAFYSEFHMVVYRFSLKRMSEPSDAAEVLNQVMLEVWRTAHRYAGRSKVQTWLLGITNHKIIDSLRKSTRHEGDEIPENLEDDSERSPFEQVSLSEHSEYIKRCLEKLTDPHRQVVHLAFFEELAYGEISQIVDCPEGTVKTRMYHAKNALKKCLKQFISS